jgi:hypothetical protein
LHAKITLDWMCLPGTSALTYFWLVCKLRIKKEFVNTDSVPLYLRRRAKIKKNSWLGLELVTLSSSHAVIHLDSQILEKLQPIFKVKTVDFV